MVTLPGWADRMDIVPKRAKTLVIVSGEGPEDAIAMPRKGGSLTVNGPGRLELEIYGIVVRRGRQTQGPGAVTVLRTGEKITTVEFGEETLDARIRRKKSWRLTQPQKVTVPLEPGRNSLEFKTTRASRGGFAFKATFAAPEPEPPAEPAPVAAADPPPSPPPPPSEAGPVEEPPLVGRGFEPEIVSEVAAESVEDVEPGFEIVGERPQSQSIRGADESGLFLQVTTGQGLKLEARGTGVLVFDYHAHRDPAQPATMEPAVLAVLLDDVLVETLKVDGPIDESLSADGQSYRLSERAQFQVTIPPGKHSVEMTLSDNALVGGSIRVRFETADVTTVASEDLPMAPEAPPMIEIREEPELQLPSTWLGFSVAGGATMTNSSAQVGAAGLADAFLMPGDFDRVFGFGLTSGFAFVETEDAVGDIRSPDSPTTVTLTEQTVPVLVDLRFALSFDDWVFMLGAGGGGMISVAETQALGSTVSTGAEWVWGVTGHASLMVRTGDGFLTLRGQWIASQPRDVENLRDFDPGFSLLSIGYVFSNR